MTKPKPKRARQLGVSEARYEELLKAQNGGCALCGRPPKTRRLHVDHDHRTGEVRGLLCFVCNRFLPASRDAAWHRKAASYLEDRPAMTPVEAVRFLAAGEEAVGQILADLQPYTHAR